MSDLLSAYGDNLEDIVTSKSKVIDQTWATYGPWAQSVPYPDFVILLTTSFPAIIVTGPSTIRSSLFNVNVELAPPSLQIELIELLDNYVLKTKIEDIILTFL
ncbi:hypothetical protein NPIL_684951 [Nephila pilipes]|uniref:Uncharacterized protein n=1 Tax=Nephila pilipes TaxID=299642 RepID=A0A8X6PEX8_NEPPI|nr:hypothetical protein NPIL_684951 [Nephila pilipes]